MKRLHNKITIHKGKPARIKPSRYSILIVLLLGLLSAITVSAFETAAGDGQPGPVASTSAPSKLRSPEDGWLDLSGFIDQAYGFVPIVMPITEPAVGYGAAGVLAFIDKPKGEKEAGFGRPNITVVGGLATENGTRGVLAGDVRYWLEERLQTLVGVVRASVNLDFSGIGRDSLLKRDPLTYNLETSGGVVQAKYRLGKSKVLAGFGYALATTKVSFNEPFTSPRLPDFQRESNVGGLIPLITYDSRDTIFTSTRGTYLDVSAGFFSKALGGDAEFQRGSLVAMHFVPLNKKWTLGMRGGTTFSFGDVPFYMRPFIALRGVPAMRYQGQNTAEFEAELRWQFWKRFSLVGFAGAGTAWNDRERFNDPTRLVSGGMGFRYELARKYGLHMGIDAAFSQGTSAIYVQFGSAWMRP